MTYDEALAYINGLIGEPRPPLAPPHRLHRMARLLDACGLRALPYPIALVAGTKGKGSTAAMLAAIGTAAGRRVGLYTKPHVSDYRERIRLDGEPIAPGRLTALVTEVAPAVRQASGGPGGRPSYFEVSVALALRGFAGARCDLGIVEVGIGGRFDATNTLDPVLSVITPISMDHTDTLGETLSAIAGHKAGIMRAGRPAVTAPQVPEAEAVLAETSAMVGAHRVRVQDAASWVPGLPREAGQDVDLRTRRADYGRLVLGLWGRHQAVNAATAVVAAELLLEGDGPSPAAVAAGLRAATLPGRFEVVEGRRPLVLDVAHNAASLAALRDTLDDYFPGRRVVLVFGMIATHDPVEPAAIMARCARLVIATEPAHPQPIPAADLAELFRRHGVPAEACSDRAAAVARARAAAGSEDVVCVTGSVYLVAGVRADVLAPPPGAPLRRGPGAAAPTGGG